ncbi:MAG: MMPL family transporter [Candidatus Nanoarchaeia archaeon]
MKFIEPALKKIAHFQIIHPILSVLIIIALSIMIWGGVSQVQTVASLELMMPETIEEIEAINTLRDSNMGKDGIVILFSIDQNSYLQNSTTDISKFEMIEYLRSIEAELNHESDILRTQSIASFVPQEISTQEEYKEFQTTPQFRELQSQFISKDKSNTILFIESDVARDDLRVQLLNEKIQGIISSSALPSGLSVEYTGTPIIQQKLGELVNQDRATTQWISLLLVFIITSLVFRSFTAAIMPLLVVFLSVNWLYGTMGYGGLPISTLAGGVAAMVVGIGIDFAIHIMNKFKYERKQGLNIPQAIEMAVVHTGTALSATSLTTIGAFLAFFVGVMPEMGSFGLLMAIGIFYALLFSVFGLPAFLILEEKLLYAIKKRSKFGVEHEFHLEGGDKK